MMRRSFLIAAAVFSMVPAATWAGTANTVEFVGGNVKSIPANTTGSLDASGSSELSFHYGKSVLRVPYQSIVHTEVTEPTGMHLWRVPVPKLGKGARFLNISYKDGESTRMLTFKAPAGNVSELVSTIEQHRNPKPQLSAKESNPEAKAASKEKASKEKTPKHVASKASKSDKKSKKSEEIAKAEKPAPEKKADIKTDTAEWWGDSYWRTTRNKTKWPQVPADNTGVPAGTKE